MTDSAPTASTPHLYLTINNQQSTITSRHHATRGLMLLPHHHGKELEGPDLQLQHFKSAFPCGVVQCGSGYFHTTFTVNPSEIDRRIQVHRTDRARHNSTGSSTQHPGFIPPSSSYSFPHPTSFSFFISHPTLSFKARKLAISIQHAGFKQRQLMRNQRPRRLGHYTTSWMMTLGNAPLISETTKPTASRIRYTSSEWFIKSGSVGLEGNLIILMAPYNSS